MARPKKEIDWELVDNLLKAHCEGTGIAGLIGVHPETLYDAVKEKYKTGFSDYQQQKRSEGKDLLRAKQFELASNGDRSMLIWLGKQYLSQKDKTDVTTGDEPITTGEITHKWEIISKPLDNG